MGGGYGEISSLRYGYGKSREHRRNIINPFIYFSFLDKRKVTKESKGRRKTKQQPFDDCCLDGYILDSGY